MTVFRVFDDEWEDIMGDTQIREFAIDQLCDKYNDFIEESEIDEEYHDKKLVDEIKKIYDNFINDNKDMKDLTMENINSIFNAFYFDYEEIEVY